MGTSGFKSLRPSWHEINTVTFCPSPLRTRNWPRGWRASVRRKRQAGCPLSARGDLNHSGVAWTPHDAKWERRFQELTAFKKRQGHCNVPAAYPENPQLGRWLTVQRHLKRRGALEADRAARLKALAGANWARDRFS